MKKAIFRNPKGSRDWLPNEVIKQEFVRKSLVKVFELWGYQPIQTPILINWDTLTQASNKLSDVAFKLIGQHAEILALRADLTTPIARVTAEQLQGESLPFRFYYIGKVFRYHARKTTNERELYQIGIELIGSNEGLSDLECLKILTDSLDELGLKKYLVLVNHNQLWNELFRSFGKIARDLHNALSQKDLMCFHSILENSKLSSKEKAFWKELIKIRGNIKAIKKLSQISKWTKKLKFGQVISYFEKIFSIFKDTVEVDLSLTSDLDYYTGIYFDIITPFLGRNVGAGGRYDRLINKFGFNTPAIGFSFCLEDLILALKKQGKVFPKFKQPKLILQNKKSPKKTFDTIKRLHEKNKHASINL